MALGYTVLMLGVQKQLPVQIAILCLASVAPLFSQSGQLAFSGAREDYFGYSGGFAMADFNGDGYPDIVTNGGGNSVEILLNDGTGHFKLAAFIPGGSSNYFAAGDFNNDGFQDVAYTTYNGGVTVILGAGNGTLRTSFYTGGGSGGDLRAVDLNGDGILDLVVGGNSVSYFIGNGDGSMQSPVTLPSLESPFAVADVNGDGYPDVIGYQYNAGIAVALNLGSAAGAFGPGPLTTLPAGTSAPLSIATGDLDGNGTTDFVVSVQTSDQVVAYSGNNTGSFTEFGTFPLSFPAYDIKLFDVNGDGKLDLLYDKTPSSHYPSTDFAIALGNENGTFGSPTNYATGGANYRIFLSDTRKSGNLDLVVGGAKNGGDISVLPNKGNGIFTQGSFETLAGVLQNTVSSDFNHDGIRDLVVSVRLSTSSSTVEPYTNSQFAGAYVLLGTGNPASPFTTAQRLYIPPDVLNLAVGDFNKDGNPDLAFVTGQDLVIFLGKGDGTFAVKASYACTCTDLAVADFNADGKPDIITNGVFLYEGNGDGTFAAPTNPVIATGYYIAAGDFNGDGKPDFLVAQSTGNGVFVIALGNGDGTFTTTTNGQASGSLFTGVIADFNGDGVPDFAEWTNYNLYVFLNTGGVFTLASSIGVGDSSKANTVAAADFNGDGHVDLLIPGFGLTVYPGNGDGTFASGSYFDAANYPNVVLGADFYDFGTGKLPDLIGVGQNGAISFLFNESQQ